MLSDCYSHKIRITPKQLDEAKWSSDMFTKDMRGLKCILDIFDPTFQDSARSIPCFGVFDDNNNLSLTLQSPHIRDILRNNPSVY